MHASHKIIRNVAYLISADVISNVVGLVIAILLARYLGTVDFGVYSYAFAFANLLLIVSDFGVSTHMIKEIARNRHRTRSIFGNVLGIKLTLAAVTVAVGVVAINVMESSAEIIGIVYLTVLTVLIVNFSTLYRMLLQAHEDLKYDSVLRIVQKVLLLGLIGSMIFTILSVLWVVLAILVVELLVLIALIMIVKEAVGLYWPRFDVSVWITMFKSSFPYWLTGVFVLIYFRIDSVMLSAIRTFEEVGLYNVSYKIIEGLMFIPTIFIVATFPSMARLYTENRWHLKLLYERSFKYLTLLAIPMAVGGMLLARRLILFIYGEQYIKSYPALQVLIWAGAFIFINYLMGYLLNSVNKQKLFTITTAVSALVNIVLNFIFIPFFGFIGAAVATLITEAVNFGLFYKFTAKQGFGLSFHRIFLRPIIASLIMGVFIVTFNFLHILVLVPLAGLLYVSLLFAMKYIGKDELNMLKLALK